LTDQLIQKAKKRLVEVENYGGMIAAIEKGIPKMRIEESAAKRQAKIDSGMDTIVGVNKYRTAEKSELDVLSIDNNAVLKSQIERLQILKSKRDESKVNEYLQKLTTASTNSSDNILEIAIEAARHRATLGEISMALEKTYGRYVAKNSLISGIYSKEMGNNTAFLKAKKMSDAFAVQRGRRPRILVAKMGQDGHDRGAKVIATAFADLGFDVDISPMFQTPVEVAKQAVENDVHVLGISSLAGGHKSLIKELHDELIRWGREDIMIVAGGVIPQKDYEHLYSIGVKHIFGPGTVIAESAIAILEGLIDG
jgi:methylmalonyl-CoA mutase